jgi:hypothetical protein
VPPIKAFSVTCLVAALALSAGACRTRQQQGLSPQVPDDFRVLARAALVVPPEYALRPPMPGEPRPQELDPEAQARQALIGTPLDPNATPGEQLLVQRAGGNTANPLIKDVIDDEQGDLTHKRRSFADLVMFWRPGQPTIETPAAGEPVVINPAEETAYIARITGGEAVVIRRRAPETPNRGFKLPGL